jgi:hypothetical protein
MSRIRVPDLQEIKTPIIQLIAGTLLAKLTWLVTLTTGFLIKLTPPVTRIKARDKFFSFTN